MRQLKGYKQQWYVAHLPHGPKSSAKADTAPQNRRKKLRRIIRLSNQSTNILRRLAKPCLATQSSRARRAKEDCCTTAWSPSAINLGYSLVSAEVAQSTKPSREVENSHKVRSGTKKRQSGSV